MVLNNQIVECLELLNAVQPSDCCVRDLAQDFEENAEPNVMNRLFILFQNPNNPNNLIIDQINYLINRTRIPF
jgi:hypothetical protein